MLLPKNNYTECCSELRKGAVPPAVLQKERGMGIYLSSAGQTGWLKQQKFISHSLEAGKSKTKAPADFVSGERLLFGL